MREITIDQQMELVIIGAMESYRTFYGRDPDYLRGITKTEQREALMDIFVC